ncbi:unnamed protein product [Moneuplotes crassus]|uniref:Uncharacterized protein n=1 Tax=Euplotes crassus TaxID=5936 RepID=A0AAD2CVR7_EUPCR|nr:unnamed protein product [Moneuplotes crassus]
MSKQLAHTKLKLMQAIEVNENRVRSCAKDMLLIQKMYEVCQMEDEKERIRMMRNKDTFYKKDIEEIKAMRREKYSIKESRKELKKEKQSLLQNIEITKKNYREMKERNEIAQQVFLLSKWMKYSKNTKEQLESFKRLKKELLQKLNSSNHHNTTRKSSSANRLKRTSQTPYLDSTKLTTKPSSHQFPSSTLLHTPPSSANLT